MGERGPLPKRRAESMGHRSTAFKLGEDIDTVKISGEVEVPPPAEYWHVIAKDWYLSLAESAAGRFMEPSDWQAARYVAQAMTENLENAKFSAVLFGQVWGAMNDLLTTEGARRRAKMEVERHNAQGEAPVSVSAIDGYRDRLSA